MSLPATRAMAEAAETAPPTVAPTVEQLLAEILAELRGQSARARAIAENGDRVMPPSGAAP